MNKLLKNFSIASVVLVVFLVPIVSFGAVPTGGGGAPTAVPTGGGGAPVAFPTGGGGAPASTSNCTGICNPLKADSIGELVHDLVDIFSYIAIIVAVLAFIWVGLQYILARGNAEKMKELTAWLGWIVVGVAVIIGAQIIITIVLNTLQSTGKIDPSVIESANSVIKK